MNAYNLNFLIALLFATVFAVLTSKHPKQRLLATIIVPTILYTSFYNYDYGVLGGISPCLIAYAGSFVSCFLFFVLYSCKKNDGSPYHARTSSLKITLLFIIQYLTLLVLIAIPWALNTFPFSNTDAVLFALFVGTNAGAEEFVISTLIDKVITPSLLYFFIAIAMELFLSAVIVKSKTVLSFKLGKSNYLLGGLNIQQSFLQLQKGILLLLVPICCCHLLLLPGIIFSPLFSALFQKPIDSKFYKEHYVFPDSIKIEPQSEYGKNLIVIFMESMATNYTQYMPEIAKLEKAASSFPPGGTNVAGTSWTIAGITGKLCGIPLNMPMGINEYHGKLPTYLPRAKCLMNVLADYGYNQVYMQGSSGDFTQKRAFWTAHGNVAVHDIEYYKNIGKIPEGYHVFWGFEDRKLYKFAKEELDSLSILNKPFALYLLTVDTHQPEGYLDDSCATEFPASEKPYLRALRCASKQLDNFLAWAREQKWYNNTTISVMGDHTLEMLSDKANVPLTDSLYWTNFILNSSITAPPKTHNYSSFDIFPTLLEAMGYKLEGRSIGLGKSLYSNEPTVLEQYGRKVLDSLLRERSYQYDYFLVEE